MKVVSGCELSVIRVWSFLAFFFQAEDGIRDYKVTGVQTFVFFFQAEDGIRDYKVTGVQTCALPISKFVPSCAAAVLVEPSPTQVRATRGSRLILNVSAIPVATGTISPTCEMGCSTPCTQAPTWRSRPRAGESSLPR